jgi:hypothetical protein
MSDDDRTGRGERNGREFKRAGENVRIPLCSDEAGEKDENVLAQFSSQKARLARSFPHMNLANRRLIQQENFTKPLAEMDACAFRICDLLERGMTWRISIKTITARCNCRQPRMRIIVSVKEFALARDANKPDSCDGTRK